MASKRKKQDPRYEEETRAAALREFFEIPDHELPYKTETSPSSIDPYSMMEVVESGLKLSRVISYIERVVKYRSRCGIFKTSSLDGVNYFIDYDSEGTVVREGIYNSMKSVDVTVRIKVVRDYDSSGNQVILKTPLGTKKVKGEVEETEIVAVPEFSWTVKVPTEYRRERLSHTYRFKKMAYMIGKSRKGRQELEKVVTVHGTEALEEFSI